MRAMCAALVAALALGARGVAAQDTCEDGLASETYTGKGTGYRGCQNVAKSADGLTIRGNCMNWELVQSQYSAMKHNTQQAILHKRNGMGNHNYCRNPDPESSTHPWCYKNTKGEWMYCGRMKTVDCVGEWTDQGTCSKTCGGGWKKQKFIVSKRAQNGGASCSASENALRDVKCNEHDCPGDCRGEWSNKPYFSQYGMWGYYDSECVPDGGATCGVSGKRTQTYKVTRAQKGDGKACEFNAYDTRQAPCTPRACPPPPPSPPPPPPSPPPPSPPPPGSGKTISVIFPQIPIVSSYQVDFKVLVSHDACGGTCAFSSSGEARNAAGQDSGLRCDVTVRDKANKCANGYGEFLPCRQWDSFYPSTLPMSDDKGNLNEGDYLVEWTCYFVKAGPEKIKVPKSEIKGRHAFKIIPDCEAYVPPGDGLENVARQLLLTSDEFNNPDCADETLTYHAKEAVFRRYDTNPTDGVLSYDEIAVALERQSADASILRYWKGVLGTVQLTPSHVMAANANDRECARGVIKYDTVTYPTNSPGREMTDDQCAQSAHEMHVSWRYVGRKRDPTDYTCSYVDGVLFQKKEKSSSAETRDELRDWRPVSGTFFDVQESLVANFLFDCNEVISTDDKGASYRGCQTTTRGGHTCQRWDSQAVHKNKYFDASDEQKAANGLTENYCRNPDSSETVWCYTTDPKTRWDYCDPIDIPKNGKLDRLYSSSPVVSGQTNSRAPSLVAPPRSGQTLKVCEGGEGGLCALGGGSGYTYEGDSFIDDFAMSAWIYVSDDAKSNSGVIAKFSGDKEALSVVIDASAKRVKVVHSFEGAISRELSLSVEFKKNTWQFVGFKLNARDRMVLFVDPDADSSVTAGNSKRIKSGGANYDSVKGETFGADKARLILASVSKLQLLAAPGVEFDDVRLYSGQVSDATFLDASKCGHFSKCAVRAQAAPRSRRVVCSMLFAGGKAASTSYSCVGSMYYDGSAIDVFAALDSSGVTFTFQDTSWDEASFEMIRKPVGAEHRLANYDTVIQMDGDLKGCANRFSSILYLDREAGSMPYREWYYQTRTKKPAAGGQQTGARDVVSTTLFFKAPWIGTLQGDVVAGPSSTAVSNVRVCAAFAHRDGSLFNIADKATRSDLARGAKVSHTNDLAFTAARNSYLVTDGDRSPGGGAVLLKSGEYLRVELSRWSEIDLVEVCGLMGLGGVAVFVHDRDTGDSGDHGHECHVDTSASTVGTLTSCLSYACVGTSVAVFRGQFVNVVHAGDEDVYVAEISVSGRTSDCEFSTHSDIDGHFEIPLQETTGSLSLNARVLVGPYKEEIFPVALAVLVNTSDASAKWPSRDVFGALPTEAFETTTIDLHGASSADKFQLRYWWTDARPISGDALATGAYVVHFEVHGGGQWWERYTGIMSWYAEKTNSQDCDNIALHAAGHARNGQLIYLRTCRAYGGRLRMQIFTGYKGTIDPTSYKLHFTRLSSDRETSFRRMVNRKKDWQHVGISGEDLETGAYAVHVEVHGGGQWWERYTGIMSWYAERTNGQDCDDIALHAAGHARNGRLIYLRTCREYGGRLYMQIRHSHESDGAASYKFHFTLLSSANAKVLRRSFKILGKLRGGDPWSNVGVSGDDLASGAYVVHMVNNNAYANPGGAQYRERYTGIMSWYAEKTNSQDCDDIALHAAGHARNGRFIRLRTCREYGGKLQLQVQNSNLDVGEFEYEFVFKRVSPDSPDSASRSGSSSSLRVPRSTETAAVNASKVLLILRRGAESAASSLGESIENTNATQKNSTERFPMSRAAFLAHIESVASFGNASHAVATDDVWSSIDVDGDGALDATEFAKAQSSMDAGSLYATPIAVHPMIASKALSNFQVSKVDATSCEALVLVRMPSSVSPQNSSSWSAFYQGLVNSNVDPLALASPCSFESVDDAVVVGDARNESFVMPLLVSGSGVNSVHLSARGAFVKKLTVQSAGAFELVANPVMGKARIDACEELTNFSPTKFVFQGSWIGHPQTDRIILLARDADESRYVAVLDQGWCKFVQFAVGRVEGTETCSLRVDSARYVAKSCADLDLSANGIVASWFGASLYRRAPLALRRSDSGYGALRIHYKLSVPARTVSLRSADELSFLPVKLSNAFANVGTCRDAASLVPRIVLMQGTWGCGGRYAETIVRLASSSKDEQRFAALTGGGLHCKIVRFTIERDSSASTCSIRVDVKDGARYTLDSACSEQTADVLDAKWSDGYKEAPVAKRETEGGYGVSAVFFDVATSEVGLRSAQEDLYRATMSTFDSVARGVVVSAKEQFADVVHVFDKSTSPHSRNAAEIFSGRVLNDFEVEANEGTIRHRSFAYKRFTDETVVVVRGAVLFPSDWTAGSSECGLFEATIEVREVDSDEEPTKYKTDESGWFEFTLTRGKSFVFTASYPKHTMCYAGKTIADAVGTYDCKTLPQNVTINRIGDGNYLFFTDVTRGLIDLGLYQGECDAAYSGATFKITPINGCHKPVYVTSEEIKYSWTAHFAGQDYPGLPEHEFTEEHPKPDSAKIWQFAAMDYSIRLDSGPSVDGIDVLIANETWSDGCATEPGDVVTFFDNRDALERLALMRDESEWQQIRYKYHGYICVDIPFVPRINKTDDMCVDPTEPPGGLSKEHFLGVGDGAEQLFKSLEDQKNIQLKVFELHMMDGKIEKCFKALPNEADASGSTLIKIRQDVSDEEDSECHPNKGGGEACDFQVVVDADQFVQFPNGAYFMSIKAGKPNLAGNHRRTVRVEVTRNDTKRTVTATMMRWLIPLGSKPRGGGGLSDDTFWATVPLDGLVYTVVHDPPGGNSYAELSSGSEVKIEWALASVRAMTVTMGTGLESTYSAGMETSIGANLGYTVEVASKVTEVEIEGGPNGAAEVDGPNFSVESESSESWDITMTTSRVIRSSQDPALPGRAGDVILGGGIELLYKISDVLDLTLKDAHGNTCLDVHESIEWLPRKPTTYVMTTHSIEAQVLPNLRFLYRVVASGESKVQADASGKPVDITWPQYLAAKIASWNRTIMWASPEDASDVLTSLTSVDSIYGKHLRAKMFDDEDSYNKLFKIQRSADFHEVTTDLAEEWNAAAGIDHAQGAPMYLLAAAFVNTWTAPLLALQTEAMSALAFVSLARLLPYIRSDHDSNPVHGTDAAGHVKVAPMSIVHPSVRSKNVESPSYDDILKSEDGEIFYSFGMNDAAAEDMDEWFDTSSTNFTGTAFRVDEGGRLKKALNTNDTKRIMASMTGGDGPVGMVDGENLEPDDTQILLTFSGGGHALDFTFTSQEGIDGADSHINFKIDGSVSFSGGFGAEEKVTAGAEITFEDAASASYGWAREFSHDRFFAWNKVAHLTTTYSLGDEHFGDKFVVSVGSDKRFGTPVFVTKGGRSLCPGELGTVFRESGVSLSIPLETKRNAENLNPGQRAIIELVITNESPYREASAFALRIVDGLAAALSDVVSAAYAEASSESATGTSVYDKVIKVADATIAKNSEDMKRVKAAADASKSGTPNGVAKAVYRAASTAPADAYEFADSVFEINGDKLTVGDYMPFKFVPGDALERQKLVAQQHLSLAVTPGVATRGIKHLQIRLQSLCESEIDLYRDPISHTVNVDAMSWSQPCPKAQFDESTVAKYLFSSQSPSSNGELNLKVNNPDQYVLWPDESLSDPALMNARLKLVRLQYRPVSGGEWITAKDEDSPETDKKFNLLCAASRTEGCKFDWKINNQFEKLLSGFKDNVYELRIKNFCFGGPALADSSVHEFVGDQRLTLSVDTKAPVATTKIDFNGETFGVEFDEAIDCSDQQVSIAKIRDACGSAGAPVSEKISAEELRGTFSLKCANNDGGYKWLVTFPNTRSGRYRVRVEGLRDVAGNGARMASFIVDAHCGAEAAVVSMGADASVGAPSVVATLGADDVHHGRYRIGAVGFVVAVFSLIAVVIARRVRRVDGDHDGEKTARPLSTSHQSSYGATL